MIRKNFDIIDARDYGVVADGVTDDAPALTAALEAAKAYASHTGPKGNSYVNGGTVMLPVGFTAVSEPIIVPNGVCLRGVNTLASVILAHSNFVGRYMVRLGRIDVRDPHHPNYDPDSTADVVDRIVSGCRVEYLSVNADDRYFESGVGVIGFFTRATNEHAGIFDCRTMRCPGGAFMAENLTIGTPPVVQNIGTAQNFSIDGYQQENSHDS